MKQNIKPITKQLLIAAFILTLVTALSFGIRQVRFSIHRAKTAESTAGADTGKTSTSARSSNIEEKTQSERSFWANAEPDDYLADSYTAEAEQDDYSADSYTVDIEPDQQYAKASASGKKTPFDGYSKTKSFKGGYVKSGGSKGLEKISLDGNEDLYLTAEGETWYVSEQPDGSTTKMQLEEEVDGEIDIVDDGKDY